MLMDACRLKKLAVVDMVPTANLNWPGNRLCKESVVLSIPFLAVLEYSQEDVSAFVEKTGSGAGLGECQ